MQTVQQFSYGKASFTRKRSLTFPTVVIAILHLFKESVEYNLLNGDVSKLLADSVTGSAFIKARYKIRPALFKQLCQMSVDCYLQMRKKRWKDLLVLAIDGSTSSLPHSKDIESHFGTYSVNKHGIKRYKSRILMVYDVLNDFVLSARLSKMCFGETRLTSECIGELAGRLSRHIYVMDRNFDSFSLLK